MQQSNFKAAGAPAERSRTWHMPFLQVIGNEFQDWRSREQHCEQLSS
jgi:hypothetical protein